MGPKIPLYNSIHKGQRKWFYDFSTQLGRMDFSDNTQIDTAKKQVESIYEQIKEHGAARACVWTRIRVDSTSATHTLSNQSSARSSQLQCVRLCIFNPVHSLKSI